MHLTALYNCKRFFGTYGGYLPPHSTIVEIGSQDVNGNLRECCLNGFKYIGVDFVAANGVDVVLDDPYKLPFDTSSIDAVVSSSCFEHSEMFWVLFLEVLRVLKPEGLFYLNVPSNGDFHRYPVDCWRFYPDSARALVTWSKRNGLNPACLESFVSAQVEDQWSDYVSVYVKDESFVSKYPQRITETKTDFHNGQLYGSDEFFNYLEMPEDRRKLVYIRKALNNDFT